MITALQVGLVGWWVWRIGSAARKIGGTYVYRKEGQQTAILTGGGLFAALIVRIVCMAVLLWYAGFWQIGGC